MCDNLDEEQKEQLKTEDNKKKKVRHDNLNVDEKEQLKKYEKKGRKLCVITLLMNKKSI